MKIKKRLIYLVCICVLIALGLASRKAYWLPNETGDALWAMTLFCFLRCLFANARLRTIASACLGICIVVEFAQLIQWHWLVTLRSTWLGHMILGQGFSWWDLLAYIVGVVAMYLIAAVTRMK